MKPKKPLPTYPVTQPASRPLPTNAAQPSSTGTTSRRRPPRADLGVAGLVSMVIEFLLYGLASMLLVIAGFGFIVGADGLLNSAIEPDPVGAKLNEWSARTHFTWSLLETCLAAFLAATGIALNHVRYVATVSKSVFSQS